MVDIVKFSQDKAKTEHRRALSQFNSIRQDISGVIDNPESAFELSHQAMQSINPQYKDQMTNELLQEASVDAVFRNKHDSESGHLYQALENAIGKYFTDEVDKSNMAERVYTQYTRENDRRPLLASNNNNPPNSLNPNNYGSSSGYGSTGANNLTVAQMRNNNNNNNNNRIIGGAAYNYHMGDFDDEAEDDDDDNNNNNGELERAREHVTDLVHVENSILSFLDDPREASRMAQDILRQVLRTEPFGAYGDERIPRGIFQAPTGPIAFYTSYPNTEQELFFLMHPEYGIAAMGNASGSSLNSLNGATIMNAPTQHAIEYNPIGSQSARGTNNSAVNTPASSVVKAGNVSVGVDENVSGFRNGIDAGLARMGVSGNNNDPYTPSSVATRDTGVGTGPVNGNINGGVPDWIQDPSVAEEMADDPQVRAATRAHKRKVSLFNAIKHTMHNKFDNKDEANMMASNVMKEILWTKDMTNELVADNSVQAAIKHHRRKVSLFNAVKSSMNETFSNDPDWADKMARSVMKQIVTNKELAKDLIHTDQSIKQVTQKHKRKISMFNALKSTMAEKFDDPKKASMMAQQVMKEIVAERKEIKEKNKKRGSVDLSKDNNNDGNNNRNNRKGEQKDSIDDEDDDDAWSLKSDDSIYEFLDNLNDEINGNNSSGNESDENKINNLLQNQNVQLQMLTHARKASIFQGLKGVIGSEINDNEEGSRLARKIMKKLVDDQKAHGLPGYGTQNGRRDSINNGYLQNNSDEDNIPIDERIGNDNRRNQRQRGGNTNDMQNVINQQADLIEAHKEELRKTKQELMACYKIIQLQNEELQKVKAQVEDLKQSKQQLAMSANESIDHMRSLIKKYSKHNK